jgi:hypothetical protein
MPYVLAIRTGLPGFLAEMRDGSWVRSQFAVNASMWEHLDDLRAWVTALADDQVARLDQVGVVPVEIVLDTTGCRPPDPRPSAPATPTPAPKTKPVREPEPVPVLPLFDGP